MSWDHTNPNSLFFGVQQDIITDSTMFGSNLWEMLGCWCWRDVFCCQEWPIAVWTIIGFWRYHIFRPYTISVSFEFLRYIILCHQNLQNYTIEDRECQYQNRNLRIPKIQMCKSRKNIGVSIPLCWKTGQVEEVLQHLVDSLLSELQGKFCTSFGWLFGISEPSTVAVTVSNSFMFFPEK